MSKQYQPRYKFNSDAEWEAYNAFEQEDQLVYKSYDKKAIGWEASELIGVSLINCCKCDNGCNKLIWYNGWPPEKCPECNVDVPFYKEMMEKYRDAGDTK